MSATTWIMPPTPLCSRSRKALGTTLSGMSHEIFWMTETPQAKSWKGHCSSAKWLKKPSPKCTVARDLKCRKHQTFEDSTHHAPVHLGRKLRSHILQHVNVGIQRCFVSHATDVQSFAAAWQYGVGAHPGSSEPVVYAIQGAERVEWQGASSNSNWSPKCSPKGCL